MTTLRFLIAKHKEYAESIISKEGIVFVNVLLNSVLKPSNFTIADLGPLGTAVLDENPIYSLGQPDSTIDKIFDMVIHTDAFFDDPLPPNFDYPTSEETILKMIFDQLNLLQK